MTVNAAFVLFLNDIYLIIFLLADDIIPMEEDIDGGERTQIEEIVETWLDETSSMRNIHFNETSKMLVEVPPNGKPYDYFKLLVDDDFLNNIIEETNKYTMDLFFAKGGSVRSRIFQWKTLTYEELLKFLGLIYHMGTIKLSIQNDYWKTHRLFNIKCYSEQMSRDRFLSILRCFHFARNPKANEPKPDDRLFKIKPVINYFNNKMRQIYYPGKNLSLDESMVLWRGRLIFRQYIANKRHKYGIKLYMLIEPSGLILNFVVYTGQFDEFRGKGHAGKVVLYLLKDFLNKGQSVYMDNYYNSCELAQELLDKDTYYTGTLRYDRKGAPKDVVKATLKREETKAKYCNGIMVGKWRDQRDVTYISTEFKNEMVEVSNKKGYITEKPLPIAEYNKYMCGIDRQDQILSYYPSLRKTLFWYKKLAVHVFQLLLFNSYILYCKYSGNKSSFYDFRLAIIEKLLPDVSIEKSVRIVYYVIHK